MSRRSPDLTRLVGDLARAVQDLQSELEPDRRLPLRPPTPRELTQFTTEVTIPALILVLETNVRALQLLQRTLRLVDGSEVTDSPDARERVESLGRTTLNRLDDALADLQEALESRPPDDDARRLLDEARDLRDEIDARLAADSSPPESASPDDVIPADDDQVDIDVESELQSIKDDIDDPDETNGK